MGYENMEVVGCEKTLPEYMFFEPISRRGCVYTIFLGAKTSKMGLVR